MTKNILTAFKKKISATYVFFFSQKISRRRKPLLGIVLFGRAQRFIVASKARRQNTNVNIIREYKFARDSFQNGFYALVTNKRMCQTLTIVDESTGRWWWRQRSIDNSNSSSNSDTPPRSTAHASSS